MFFPFSFAARQFTVRLGDIDLERDDEPSSPATYKVKNIRAHPKFSRVGFYNDIAILELNRPVRKTPYIVPICIPQVRHKNDQFAGARPTVVGWGTTYYGKNKFLFLYSLNIIINVSLIFTIKKINNFFRRKRKYSSTTGGTSCLEKRRLQCRIFSANNKHFSVCRLYSGWKRRVSGRLRRTVDAEN